MTDVGGTLGFTVLSTRGVIGPGPTRLCRVGGERTAAMFVHPLLEEGQECVARASLTEMVGGRKLPFDGEVTEGERTIGVGTHERRVISRG